jgi:peptidylprolyl isomerase
VISSRRLTALAAVLVVPVVALAGCSSSSSSSAGASSAAPSDSAAPPSDTGAASPSASLVTTDLKASDVKVTGGLKETPKVTFPTPSAASALSTTDVVVGTGAVVKDTDTITVNYVGIGALTGKEFDSSFSRGQAATFPLAQLIPGWQQGIPGMKVGGRRVLVIPAELAYGANPPTADIQPNETLVFVMDVVAIAS